MSPSKRRPPVLAHTLKDPWPALNCFPCCQNSSYQILFYIHTGLINEIHEVTTKEEVPVTISVFRRLLGHMYYISNWPNDPQTAPLQTVLIYALYINNNVDRIMYSMSPCHLRYSKYFYFSITVCINYNQLRDNINILL